MKITDDLELNKPTFEVNKVSYNWANDMVNIEIIFKEENGLYKHSRTFSFLNEGGKELTQQDIETFIGTHEILSQI